MAKLSENIVAGAFDWLAGLRTVHKMDFKPLKQIQWYTKFQIFICYYTMLVLIMNVTGGMNPFWQPIFNSMSLVINVMLCVGAPNMKFVKLHLWSAIAGTTISIPALQHNGTIYSNEHIRDAIAWLNEHLRDSDWNIGDRFTANGEHYMWCQSTLSNVNMREHDINFSFRRKSDAALFRLVFGGKIAEVA